MFPFCLMGAFGGSMVPSGLMYIVWWVFVCAVTCGAYRASRSSRSSAGMSVVFIVFFLCVFLVFGIYGFSSQFLDLKTVFPANLNFRQSFSGHISTHRRQSRHWLVVTSPLLFS